MASRFDEDQQRNPLLDQHGFETLKRLREHPHAPAWNYAVGDRVVADDLPQVDAFRERVAASRTHAREPSDAIVEWIAQLRRTVPAFRDAIPEGLDLRRDWHVVRTSGREQLATQLAEHVPIDASYERFIFYPTSGTSTGHAIHVPHHPLAMALNQVLGEYALNRHGAESTFESGSVACMNISAQRRTYTFAAVFSIWSQAGFAKINLTEGDWRTGGRRQAARFVEDLAPAFLTGDPVAFAEMLAWELPVAPRAMLSTAVALPEGVRRIVEAKYGAPVIDWYSSTETGPIAFAAPDGHGFEITAPDLFVELLDVDGHPVGPGERGEITVTGGRNPYLPLLRYRTGDHAGWSSTTPDRLVDLVGREPVFFRAFDGSIVNPVDIGRALQMASVYVQHEVVQHPDGTLDAGFRPVPGHPVDLKAIERELRAIFGADQPINVRLDDSLADRTNDGKVAPYRSSQLLPSTR